MKEADRLFQPGTHFYPGFDSPGDRTVRIILAYKESVLVPKHLALVGSALYFADLKSVLVPESFPSRGSFCAG